MGFRVKVCLQLCLALLLTNSAFAAKPCLDALDSEDDGWVSAPPGSHAETLQKLSLQTSEYQRVTRKKWDERASSAEHDYAEPRSYLPTKLDPRFATQHAHIDKIVSELPRSDADKASARRVLESLLEVGDNYLIDYDLWLKDVQGRSPEDKLHMIFEAVQADAMLRDNPKLTVDMGVDADAKKTGFEAGKVDKSLDLTVHDGEADVFYKVEVKSILSNTRPYAAIGSFVAKSQEVSAKEENPSLKLLALYTDFPKPVERTGSTREVIDEYGVLRRYTLLPDGSEREINSENLVLKPIHRSLEGFEKTGRTHVIFGIDALNRTTTARQRLLRDSDSSWTEVRDRWERQTFIGN